MVTPRKRNASRSPEGSRQIKRLLTSSPEEGEVDELNPPPLKAVAPLIAPITLPPKPQASTTTKVPFPFKKKADVPRNGGEAATSNVFERYDSRAREDRNRGKPAHADHWEPSYGRGEPLRSRLEPYDNYGRNDHPDWDRGRRRTPIRNGYSSRSPSPHNRGRHRLLASHSPTTYSPASPRGLDKTRERSRERGYDRDFRDRREDDSRRYGRTDLSNDERYYRPSTPNGCRRDEREWTWRDRGHDYGNRSSRWPLSRRGSPGPLSRSEAFTPRPPGSAQPRSPPLPEPGTPSRNSGPRPPSSTPPPAPPPDPRLIRPSLPPPPPPTSQLPPFRTQISIHVQRPDAPMNVYSPVALDMQSAPSTAKAMAHGIKDRADQPSQPQAPRPEPPNEKPLAKKEFKAADHPIIQSIRSKPLVRRTLKEEMQAYGHGFTGCGKQDDYETTTKLGEGTFGFVFCHILCFCIHILRFR